ncbi:MAG: arylsulfatase [Opitutaceae bacterium]|nr:arylsulfatase [Opitutaceae bacterium]
MKRRSCRNAMPRRDFLRTMGIGAASLTAPAILRGAGKSQRRPNVLLILADDMGYSDLSCYGSEIRTPHLDALAGRGVRFTQFYNCAVCCPTRASLLTGLYPHQAGVGWMVMHGADARPPGPYQGWLNDRCVTIAEVMKGAGYRTLMSGKWHVGESRPHWPADRGFDRSFGLISGSSNYYSLTKDYLPNIKRQMFSDDRPWQPPEEGFYMTDAIVDNAVRLLAETAQERDPFFCYLAFTAPHYPLHASPEAIARHRGRYRGGWDAMRAARYARMKELGLIGPETPLSPRENAVPAWADVEDPDLMDLQMAIYAAQVESMDAGIGRVLAELRRTGKDRDTVVMFLSDNGSNAEADLRRFRRPELNRAPYLGGPESYEAYADGWANASNTPFRKYKTYFQEGGICTPLIVAGPGVTAPAGSICHEPGHVTDLMATCVDLGQASYPTQFKGHAIQPMEGVSFRPLLEGRQATRQRPIFWELEGRYAMRAGPWKLIGQEDKPWELYDLSRDRTELRNLAAEQPERLQKMAADHTAWAQRIGVQSWKQVKPTMVNIPGVG